MEHPKKTEGLLSNVLNIGNHCQNSLLHVLFAQVQSKAEHPDYKDYGTEYRNCKKIKNTQIIYVVS
jgi:hypothetical protein